MMKKLILVFSACAVLLSQTPLPSPSGGGGGGITTPVSIANGGTGTGSTLTGLVRGNASAMTAAELSGDVTTSGSNVATVGKVNGIAYSGTAAAHTVQVTTTANTTVTPKVLPDCVDTGGNHLNFTQSTDAFSCGTTSGAAYNCAPTTIGPGFCQVTVSSAQILALGTGANSIMVISAPGAGLITQVTSITAKYNFVTAAYVTATAAFGVCYDNACEFGVGGGATDAVQTFSALLANTSSKAFFIIPSNAWLTPYTVASTSSVNKAVFFANIGGAFTTGAGNLVVDINYVVQSGF